MGVYLEMLEMLESHRKLECFASSLLSDPQYYRIM